MNILLTAILGGVWGFWCSQIIPDFISMILTAAIGAILIGISFSKINQ